MIEVDGLSYRYPGRAEPVLRDLSFSLGQGEVFGLLGPSGAGKTTTQKVLTRQLLGYSGRVQVMGRELSSWDRRYFQQIGVVFEFPTHYLKLTARENLSLFASLYDRTTLAPEDALARVGLLDEADRRVGLFSKGMMVRLGFARALLHDPALLFLDEPTAGLDPVNAGIIRNLIRQRRSAGATIVLATHNMRDVELLCDRVAFIVGGRLAAVDTPDALMLRHGRRQVEVQYLYEGAVLSEEFPLDGLSTNQEFLDLLRETEIRRIHTQEASLDRVFAAVTGAELEGGA